VVRGRKNNRDAAQENHENQKNKQYFTDLIHKISLPCSRPILKPGKICPLFRNPRLFQGLFHKNWRYTRPGRRPRRIRLSMKTPYRSFSGWCLTTSAWTM
jgi:hypothetical protein